MVAPTRMAMIPAPYAQSAPSRNDEVAAARDLLGVLRVLLGGLLGAGERLLQLGLHAVGDLAALGASAIAVATAAA